MLSQSDQAEYRLATQMKRTVVYGVHNPLEVLLQLLIRVANLPNPRAGPEVDVPLEVSFTFLNIL